MTLEELLAQLERLPELTADELAELRDALVQHADEIFDAGDPSTEDEANLEAIASGLEAISAEEARREDEAAAAAERMDALRRRIHGDPDQEQEQEAAADESTEADGEADEEADPDGEQAEGQDQEAAEERDAEPVAAAGTPAPQGGVPVQRLGAIRANARRPRSMAPRRNTARASWTLVAGANQTEVPAGTRISDFETLGRLFESALQAADGYTNGARFKAPVVSAKLSFGPDEILTADPDVNAERLMRRGERERALAASGGMRTQAEVDYTIPILGSEDRPVKGALRRFGVARGAVTTHNIPSLADVDGGIGVWTDTNDQAPSSPATKPYVTVGTPSTTTTRVQAITRRIRYGNFRQKFFPEQVEAWLKLLLVAWAREAEEQLISTISSQSTAITAGQVAGAVPDLLAVLDRYKAQFNSRYRDQRVTHQLLLPAWVKQLARVDTVRRADVPGTTDELFAMTDQALERWITQRGFSVTWLLDGESGQTFGSQPAGHLLPWPSTVRGYIFPQGSWLFLDGGTIDLGLVRDSTLVGTNDVEAFAESFEAAHFHGVESVKLDFDLCPDGSTSTGKTLSICSTGS